MCTCVYCVCMGRGVGMCVVCVFVCVYYVCMCVYIGRGVCVHVCVVCMWRGVGMCVCCMYLYTCVHVLCVYVHVYSVYVVCMCTCVYVLCVLCICVHVCMLCVCVHVSVCRHTYSTQKTPCIMLYHCPPCFFESRSPHEPGAHIFSLGWELQAPASVLTLPPSVLWLLACTGTHSALTMGAGIQSSRYGLSTAKPSLQSQEIYYYSI